VSEVVVEVSRKNANWSNGNIEGFFINKNRNDFYQIEIRKDPLEKRRIFDVFLVNTKGEKTKLEIDKVELDYFELEVQELENRENNNGEMYGV
jgi:hypothetical protein